MATCTVRYARPTHSTDEKILCMLMCVWVCVCLQQANMHEKYMWQGECTNYNLRFSTHCVCYRHCAKYSEHIFQTYNHLIYFLSTNWLPYRFTFMYVAKCNCESKLKHLKTAEMFFFRFIQIWLANASSFAWANWNASAHEWCSLQCWGFFLYFFFFFDNFNSMQWSM